MAAPTFAATTLMPPFAATTAAAAAPVSFSASVPMDAAGAAARPRTPGRNAAAVRQVSPTFRSSVFDNQHHDWGGTGGDTQPLSPRFWMPATSRHGSVEAGVGEIGAAVGSPSGTPEGGRLVPPPMASPGVARVLSWRPPPTPCRKASVPQLSLGQLPCHHAWQQQQSPRGQPQPQHAPHMQMQPQPALQQLQIQERQAQINHELVAATAAAAALGATEVFEDRGRRRFTPRGAENPLAPASTHRPCRRVMPMLALGVAARLQSPPPAEAHGGGDACHEEQRGAAGLPTPRGAGMPRSRGGSCAVPAAAAAAASPRSRGGSCAVPAAAAAASARSRGGGGGLAAGPSAAAGSSLRQGRAASLQQRLRGGLLRPGQLRGLRRGGGSFVA